MSQTPRPPRRKSRATSPRPANDDREAFVPPEFEHAHPRPRFDGWTAERQTRFIQALGESACVTDACRAVGMSEHSAYALRVRTDAVSSANIGTFRPSPATRFPFRCSPGCGNLALEVRVLPT